MFTIRHIDANANESVFAAESVTYTISVEASTSDKKEVFAHHGNGTTIISSGTVYVMNEYGKTVAVYSFPNPPRDEYDRAGSAHAVAGLRG